MAARRSIRDRGRAEHVDAREEEQPHHVDEVPIPRCRLEAEVPRWGELPCDRAEKAHRQEDRPDDHVETMEAGCHEEGRTVNGPEIARTRGEACMRRVSQRCERRAVEAK